MTPELSEALSRARRRFPSQYEMIRAIAAAVGVNVEGDESAPAPTPGAPPEPMDVMLARLAAIPGVRVVRGGAMPPARGTNA